MQRLYDIEAILALKLCSSTTGNYVTITQIIHAHIMKDRRWLNDDAKA